MKPAIARIDCTYDARTHQYRIEAKSEDGETIFVAILDQGKITRDRRDCIRELRDLFTLSKDINAVIKSLTEGNGYKVKDVRIVINDLEDTPY